MENADCVVKLDAFGIKLIALAVYAVIAVPTAPIMVDPVTNEAVNAQDDVFAYTALSNVADDET